MDEYSFDDFEVEIDPQKPLYIIGVVSEMVEIPIWTLRKLDEMNVVNPCRVGKSTRCYSLYQIKKLRYVRYLMQNKHVNISGIKLILELEEKKGGGND